MRKLILFLLFLNLAVQAIGQTDSATIAGTHWTKKKLIKGVTWKAFHFTGNAVFGANENINIIEISPSSKKARLVVGYSDSLQTTSSLAKSNHALAAINGSFFKMRGADPDYNAKLKAVPKKEPAKLDRNRSIVYLRVRDSLISPQVFTKDSIRRRHQQGVVAMRDREVFILKADTSTLAWEGSLQAHDIMSSGPVLLIANRRQRIPNDAFCNDRHPRTAVGRKADGTVVLLVVDGRAAESAGMSIPELQKTLHWLGCIDAINLDGGGSTTMYIEGKPYNGVVNYPTDNKQFDHAGEREVANVLLLLRK